MQNVELERQILKTQITYSRQVLFGHSVRNQHPKRLVGYLESLPVQAFHDDLEPAMPRFKPYAPRSKRNALAIGAGEYGVLYYLNALPLHDGARISVLKARVWLEGIYTWSGDLNDPPKLVFYDLREPVILNPTDKLCWTNPLELKP